MFPIFNPEDGDSMFLRNASIPAPTYESTRHQNPKEQLLCRLVTFLQRNGEGKEFVSRPNSICEETNYTVVGRHQTARFKDMEMLRPAYRAAASQEYSVASFATVRVASCLHSHEIRCSCFNGVQFSCDLATGNLVTATIITPQLPTALLGV
jgi:hypothetical protein